MIKNPSDSPPEQPSPDHLAENPYEPPRDVGQLEEVEAADPTDVTPKPGFRLRTVPAAICLMLGIGWLAACGYWALQIWNITIASDDSISFKFVPPILFVSFALGGITMLFASRCWMRGRTSLAIGAFLACLLLMQLVLGLVSWLAPEMVRP